MKVMGELRMVAFSCQGRPEGGISAHKAPFAHEHAPMKDLAEIVRDLKPTCLVSLFN